MGTGRRAAPLLFLLVAGSLLACQPAGGADPVLAGAPTLPPPTAAPPVPSATPLAESAAPREQEPPARGPGSRIPYDTGDYVRLHPVVLLGTAGNPTAVADPAAEVVYHDYPIAVAEVFKGDLPGPTAVVRTVGVYLRWGTPTPGFSALAPGRQYLLYLAPWRAGPAPGVFEMSPDYYRVEADGTAELRGYPPRPRRPLADLRRDVALAVAGRLPTRTPQPAATASRPPPPSGYDTPRPPEPIVSATPVYTPWPGSDEDLRRRGLPTSTRAPTATDVPPTWPLLGTPPRRCPAYTQPADPARPWPTVDPRNPATLESFDPCVLRQPRRATALGPTGGPYLDRRDLIGRTAADNPGNWTKVRAYLVTHAAAHRLVGSDAEDPNVYPDREVWLVVFQGDGCAVPSGLAGSVLTKPWYCHWIVDATDGRSYGGGSQGPNNRDWPPFLPDD